MSNRSTHRGIVVGVDGSSSSDVAVRWAVREAAMRNVPLALVHVVASSAIGAVPVAWPATPVPDEVLRWREENARNIIAAATKLAEDTIENRPEIRGDVAYGGAVPVLVDLSKEADMVVVGCHGRQGWRRLLLGSVSSGLIHHAHGPVAVVHDEAPSSGSSEQLPVLVGIDGSRASESAIAIAFDEASWRGVDLVALHVWSDADMSTVPGMEQSVVMKAAEKTLAESLAGWQERYPDVTVRRVVEFEQPARNLLEHSDRAQLVVVGSHGRGGFTGMLLGSVSTAVAQAASVPVIVARQR